MLIYRVKFSRKTDYGIILMKGLEATYARKNFVSTSEIAEQYKISPSFLEKLADILRKNNYLEAKRGNKGGYRLIKNPKNITIEELINVFEEPAMMRCLYSKHPKKICPLVSICPTRRAWVGINEQVQRIFRKTTLAKI